MRKPILISFTLLLSGCALFERPPRSDAAALQSQAKAGLDKSLFIDSQTKMYERQGASHATVQATATTDYNMQAAVGK
jgi:hypothetical protein